MRKRMRQGLRPADVERGACDVGRGVRAGRRERAWGSGSTSGAHAERTRLEGSGGRVRAAERTSNMRFMSVTREVSQLEMSALKFVIG